MAQAFNIIGKGVKRRIDGYQKVSGEGLYARDQQLPKMIFAKAYLSPYAHAKIKKMDTTKAETLPGMWYILKYDDPWLAQMPLNKLYNNTSTGVTTPIPDTAVFYGQPVGFWACAETEEICDEAIRLVEIEWEQLPVCIDHMEAIKPGATVCRPDRNPDNNEAITGEQMTMVATNFGDVEKGLTEADKIITFHHKHDDVTWADPEPHCCVAHYKGDFLEIWIHHQCPSDMHYTICQMVSMPEKNIMVHTPYQGGFFGGFNWLAYSGMVCGITAELSKRTGRPVKGLFDGQQFKYGSHWNGGDADWTIGVKNDGTITAVKAQSYWLPLAGNKLNDHTKIPNILVKNTGILVNKGPRICMRHGAEQTPTDTLVFEHVAGELKLDPTKVALLNDGGKGHDMAWINTNIKAKQGFDPNRDSLKECIEAGKKAMDWDNKWHLPGTKQLPNGKMHGIGMMHCHSWSNSYGDKRTLAGVSFRKDGTVQVQGLRADIGVGAETSYCQIVAEETGMKYEDVGLWSGEDTPCTLFVPGGSMGLVKSAPALKDAANKAKKSLLVSAVTPKSGVALFPGLTAEDLDIKDSMVFEIANPDNKMPVSKVTEYWFGMWSGTNMRIFEVGYGPEAIPISYADRYYLGRQAYFCEVEVDTDTGMVEVTKVACSNDVGVAINPDFIHGQQYGGVHFGIGQSLTEKIEYDPQTGVKLNDNFCNYAILGMLDLGPVDCNIIETAFGYGTYGASGIGESPGACTPSIMGPAVFNALGVYIDDFPITPDKVLKALGKA